MNYVWCTTSVLGKGATGAVYQGVNKINGEPVAVKTFNQLSYMRPGDVQLREFEVLRRVNHKNIVKLLAIEEEQQDGRGKVIVMELCTGGSLFNILDDPENTYGLEEKEFLLVLDHLSAGMKHLRDNNLVHRDLKPGNIMKFISDDGSTIYKLTDFGAARELQDGQEFNSLYGTEEYLHPDMYERAVLRKPQGKTFGATVDLWSIGVTLYHVATGNLPFRPYGGRRNKETMFHITTKKASGVISGIQTEDKGSIEWSRELPVNCQLSAGLKKIVTPLLAGLLEADQKNIWSFEKFFNESTNILLRKKIDIFHINRATNIKIYIHPDDIFEQLVAHIAEQTDIQAENQILLCKSNLFLDEVGSNARALGYPATVEQEPLVLFSKENNNVSIIGMPDLPRFPEFANIVSVENDAAQAKTACSIAHVCKRRVEKISRSTALIKYSVNNFTNYIKNKLRTINTTSRHLKQLTTNQKMVCNTFQVSQNTINALSKTKITVTELPEDLEKLSEDFLTETYSKVTQVYEKHVHENTLQLEWDSSCNGIKCPSETKAAEKAKNLIERLRDSWQHLVRDRATRSLSYNDEQFHVLERTKITETNRRIKQLLESDCVPAYNHFAEILGDWYKIAQTIYLKTVILNKDVNMYENKLENFTQNLGIYNTQYMEDMQAVLDHANNGTDTPNAMNITQKRKLRSIFKEAEKYRTNIEDILRYNGELIKTIERLTKKVDIEDE